MKLSHTFRSPVTQRVPKLIGLNPRGHENNETNQNWNLNSIKNSQKYEQYTGYSTPGSTKKICPYQSALTYSQANDRITEFQNVLFNTSQRNASTQIKSARQDYGRKEYQGITQRNRSASRQKQNHVRIKEEILQEVYRIIHEHKEQSAKSLRQAVFKIDESIKRDCITQFNRQFISLSFLDDIDRRFNQFEEQIKNQNKLIVEIQRNIQKQKYSRDDKIYRSGQQIQQIKNQIQTIKFNHQMESNNKLSNISIFQRRCTNIERLCNQISIAKGMLEQEVKKINLKLNSEKKYQQVINKFKRLQNQIQQIRSSGKSQIKLTQIKQESLIKCQIQQQKDKIAQRGSLQNDKLFQILQMSQTQLKSGLSLSLSMQSLDANANSNSKFVKKLNSSVNSLKHIKSTKYILDICNQLMDQSGKYILDEEGKHIKLSDDQILILRESNIVKYQQP